MAKTIGRSKQRSTILAIFLKFIDCEFQDILSQLPKFHFPCPILR